MLQGPAWTGSKGRILNSVGFETTVTATVSGPPGVAALLGDRCTRGDARLVQIAWPKPDTVSFGACCDAMARAAQWDVALKLLEVRRPCSRGGLKSLWGAENSTANPCEENSNKGIKRDRRAGLLPLVTGRHREFLTLKRRSWTLHRKARTPEIFGNWIIFHCRGW